MVESRRLCYQFRNVRPSCSQVRPARRREPDRPRRLDLYPIAIKSDFEIQGTLGTMWRFQIQEHISATALLYTLYYSPYFTSQDLDTPLKQNNKG